MSENKGNSLATVKKDTVEIAEQKIFALQKEGKITFPADYSVENAMQAAWLILQESLDRNKKPVLESCSRPSIANSLLSMAIQGLNPDKKQCYFIAYGSKLTLMRSYFGTMRIAKLVDPNIDEIVADVVYKGDRFILKYVRGHHIVEELTRNAADIKSENIIGAFCSIYYKNGKEDTTYMPLDDIKNSWRQSVMQPIDDNGNIKAGSTHAKFTAEMCKRTVTNKACKPIINSSSDKTLVQNVIESDQDAVEAELQAEISEKANKDILDIDPETGELIGENSLDDILDEEEPAEQEQSEIGDDLP